MLRPVFVIGLHRSGTTLAERIPGFEALRMQSVVQDLLTILIYFSIAALVMG